MPGPYILDTNAVIYYVGGEAKVLERIIPIMRSDAVVMLPAIVITELWSGTQTSSTEISAIEAFIATLVIIPLEMQIAYKLFLGSEKDIEDAKHLYNMFKDKLDASLLKEFNKKLKIEEAFKRYLA